MINPLAKILIGQRMGIFHIEKRIQRKKVVQKSRILRMEIRFTKNLESSFNPRERENDPLGA